MPRIIADRRKTGEFDFEAVELAFRTALHSAGAAGLTELLRQPGPVPTSVPCACGGQSRYKDMRLKPILTVLGPKSDVPISSPDFCYTYSWGGQSQGCSDPASA